MKRFALLLAALLASTALVGAAQHGRHKKASAKPLGVLRSDLARLRDKKRRLKAELRKTKRQAKSVLDDIQAVDARLSNLEDELAATTDHLNASLRAQSETTQALNDTSNRLDVARERVRKRLRWMYMQGDTSLLSAFIGAQSVGDIATRQSLYQRIAEKDREVFNDYRRLTRQLAEHKRQVDGLVRQVSTLQTNQRDQESSLEDARHTKKGYLRELQSRVGELQELVDQFEEDERSITAQIQAFDARPGRGPALPPFVGRLSRPINARITSGFGMRYHPILHIVRLHAGVDFGAPVGTIIHAAGDGVVISAQQMRGYGNVVIIDHGGGLSTVYAHCSRFLVVSGERVARGQPIAAVGSTGLSTGPHLHFEVRIHGRPVNPLSRL